MSYVESKKLIIRLIGTEIGTLNFNLKNANKKETGRAVNTVNVGLI